MKILEELWYGNLSPIAQGYFRSDKAKEFVELYETYQSQLLPTLSQEQKEIFDKLHEAWMQIQELAECESFVTGFSLAVQIMVEATTKKTPQ